MFSARLTGCLVAAALLLGVVGGYSAGHKAEALRAAAELANVQAQHSEQAKEQAKAHAKAINDARTKEQAHAQAAQDALNAARTREIRLRQDIALARSELGSVQHAADAALRDAGTSFEACTHRAAAFRAVFGACAAELEDVAGRADRHASDIQTLTEAWPQKP